MYVEASREKESLSFQTVCSIYLAWGTPTFYLLVVSSQVIRDRFWLSFCISISKGMHGPRIKWLCAWNVVLVEYWQMCLKHVSSWQLCCVNLTPRLWMETKQPICSLFMDSGDAGANHCSFFHWWLCCHGFLFELLKWAHICNLHRRFSTAIEWLTCWCVW